MFMDKIRRKLMPLEGSRYQQLTYMQNGNDTHLDECHQYTDSGSCMRCTSSPLQPELRQRANRYV